MQESPRPRPDQPPGPHEPTRPPRAVVLRHTLPDAASHHDLLIERPPRPTDAPPDPDARRLIAFRVDPPPHEPATVSADATRLPDHRALYLDYEGPIPPDRGHVTRLATATLTRLTETESRIDARLTFSDRACDLVASRVRADRWRLSLRWTTPD